MPNGTNPATYPGHEEGSSAISHLASSPVRNITEHGNSESSPSQFIVKLPCISRVKCTDGNAERQICVTLHDDNVARVWSMETKRLSRELRSSFRFSDDTVWVAICPAKPDILMIYDCGKVSKPGNLNIEAWNWVENRKIHIIINTKFTPGSGYLFVPTSPIAYTHTGTGDLIVIDLDVPPEEPAMGLKVSLSDLAISVRQNASFNRGSLFRCNFITHNEIAIIWRRVGRWGLLHSPTKYDYFFEVARLSSIASEEGQEKPLIGERYSPSIVGHARVISKFQLPNSARLLDMKVVPENQTVLFVATRKSQGSDSFIIIRWIGGIVAP
ncbi:hypothetical protein E0Z10_g6928 [Xylaria hypoxylon]|uniref:CNH domain-containing protein n=1 Tax=Xylaria hypoxylon TaxID=37992 RepID=A0A4Z0YPA3_9PEZI|nr:hypothetical protein E0Z10_g6928 [Xylaria hypoxylon]